jgi:hypothetical protein
MEPVEALPWRTFLGSHLPEEASGAKAPCLSLEELRVFSEKLSPEERDELLQCLLVAAPRGGEAMLQVLEQVLLRRATEELLAEHRGVEQ